MLLAKHQQEIKENHQRLSLGRTFSPCTACTPVPLEVILSPSGGRLGHVRFFSFLPHITRTNSSLQVASSGVPVQQYASIQKPRPSYLANGSIRGHVEFGLDGNEVAFGIRGQVGS